MIWCDGLFLRVALGHLVGRNDVVFKLMKHDLCQKDVISHVVRSLETAAIHVVGEDRLEARSMSIEEVFLSLGVEERTPFVLVAEQRVWMTSKHLATELEVLPAHVHTYSIIVVRPAFLYVLK